MTGKSQKSSSMDLISPFAPAIQDGSKHLQMSTLLLTSTLFLCKSTHIQQQGRKLFESIITNIERSSQCRGGMHIFSCNIQVYDEPDKLKRTFPGLI